MKLSEALRLGEFALKPSHGAWFVANVITGEICGACAAGRALYAVGYRPEKLGDEQRYARFLASGEAGYYGEEYDALKKFMNQQWPWTVQYTHKLIPDRWGRQRNAALDLISETYEKNEFTMSQIAELIEQLEAQYDTQPAAEAALTTKEVSCGRH